MTVNKGFFSNLYKKIGEESYRDIAEWLLRLMCISPLIAGIVNHIMLLDIPSYDPYLYNRRWIVISDIGFVLMTICFVTYTCGKIAYNKWTPKMILLKIKSREPWLIFWLCLIIWGFVTCLASADIKGAFFGATVLYSGYITHIFMLCVMGCTALLSVDGRKRLLNTYIVVSDILAMIMIGFNYAVPFWNSFSGYAGVATFTNSNHYGYYLAMAIPCLAGLFFISYDRDEVGEKGHKLPCLLYLASFIMHMHAMVLNDCMGGFLGALFALIALTVLWVIRKKKLKIAYMVPILFMILMVWLSYVGLIKSILGTTIGTSLPVLFRDIFSVAQKKEGYEAAGTNRIQLWKEAIEAIRKRPLLGYGPDITLDKSGRYCVSLTPHNEFLECALYMGVPGLVMYLGGLIKLFVSRIKKLKVLTDYSIVAAASVIGYQVSAFFGVRKFHVVPYMFMFLGMIIMRENGKNKEKEIDIREVLKTVDGASAERG